MCFLELFDAGGGLACGWGCGGFMGRSGACRGTNSAEAASAGSAGRFRAEAWLVAGGVEAAWGAPVLSHGVLRRGRDLLRPAQVRARGFARLGVYPRRGGPSSGIGLGLPARIFFLNGGNPSEDQTGGKPAAAAAFSAIGRPSD